MPSNLSAISVYKSIGSIAKSGSEKISTAETLYRGTEMLGMTVKDIQEGSAAAKYIRGLGIGGNIDQYA